MEPGLHIKLSRNEYEQIDGANWSSIRLFSQKPEEFRFISRQDKSSRAMDMGTCIHMALLEPEKYKKVVTCYPKTRRGAAWEAFEVENADKIILYEKDRDKIEIAVDAALDNSALADLLKLPGEPETCLVWQDKQTGMRCKGLVDRWLDCGVLLEIKTTTDTCRTAINKLLLGKDRPTLYQLAFYRQGLRALGFDPRVVLAVIPTADPAGGLEIEPDFVRTIAIPEWLLEYGEAKIRPYKEKFAEHFDDQTWPTYPDFIEEFEFSDLDRWTQEDVVKHLPTEVAEELRYGHA